MANKPLKSITFPELADTYTVPVVDATLTVSGDAADAKLTGDRIAALTSTLKTYLIPILRAGVYTSDQSDVIDDLDDALNGETPTPVGPITPSYSSGTLTLSGFAGTPSWTI